MRQVLLYQDEDGAWIARALSLPGCVSDGATPAEALANVRDAMETMVDFLKRRGEPVPADTQSAQIVAIETFFEQSA